MPRSPGLAITFPPKRNVTRDGGSGLRREPGVRGEPCSHFYLLFPCTVKHCYHATTSLMRLACLLFAAITAFSVASAQSLPLKQDSSIVPGTSANYGRQQVVSIGGANGF